MFTSVLVRLITFIDTVQISKYRLIQPFSGLPIAAFSFRGGLLLNEALQHEQQLPVLPMYYGIYLKRLSYRFTSVLGGYRFVL